MASGFNFVVFKDAFKRLKKKTALTCICLFLTAHPAQALTDEELIRGFNLTVFGSEIAPLGFQANYVHKFRDEVRFKIHDLASTSRRSAAEQFINSLEQQISGLNVRIVNQTERSNFNVYIVDRADYAHVVRERVEKRSNASVPGKCLVKSRFSRAGISRSDAVIVSDEGEALFRRCLVEEILQGLGPLNENTSLKRSVFNDTSTHTRFTEFDRIILNMLYDSRIKNGASERSVSRVLREVLSDTRKRLGN